jgi:hypothetical protein
MRSNSVLVALAVVACIAGAVARIFHGHKPLADIAFVVFAVAAVALIAAVLYRALRSRRTAATLTVAVACALAGTAWATTIPKATWIAKADATCKKIDARVAAIPQPKVNPANPSRGDLPVVGRYLGRLQPLLAREIAAVSALPTPSTDSALAHGFVVSAHSSVTALAESEKAAAHGDLATYKESFLRDNRAGTRASAIAKRLGLHVCGR